jgi:hypothetical protein
LAAVVQAVQGNLV